MPGANLIGVDEWVAGDGEARVAALVETVRGWRERALPSGLLSDSLFLGEDGLRVLRYRLWADRGSFEAKAGDRPDGVEGAGPSGFTVYRGGRGPGDVRVPASLALPQAVFDGPDHDRLRAWVDAVFAALATDVAAGGESGGISAYFHVSLDGRRVLNYAEWVSAWHHDVFLGVGVPETDVPDEVSESWRQVHEFPGLVGGGVHRYHLYATATP